MIGIEKAYCNVCISAVITAWRSLMELPAAQLLSYSKYGKGDTLTLDAIPEITIDQRIKSFDKYGILVTEEFTEKSALNWPDDPEPVRQPLMLFSDPTDRSSQLGVFLKHISQGKETNKMGDLLADINPVEVWETVHGKPESPAIITGATSSITCIRKGEIIFSVILNLVTQTIFVATEIGIYYWVIPNFTDKKLESVDLDVITKHGKILKFPPSSKTCETADDCKRFVTFLGAPNKTGYIENFKDCMIFVDAPDHFVHHRVPGGPARILYLSELQNKHGAIGFIMANGEKIGEWIHWLSFAKFAHNSSGGKALRVFEVSIDRPWTKEGILMSTHPQYSIFRATKEGTYVDVSKLRNFHSPSRFRSMLIVTPFDNERITLIMRNHEYREIFVI